jgi:N-acetylglucosaminyl-diphospho-decaprenol L-rhamnosyltransferase
VADLAVIVVSYNSRVWLEPCLGSIYAHAGDLEVDVVVVDNASTDGSAELVEELFPQARVLRSPNRGFAYGNNRGLEIADAPFVLFLNPDAAIVEGTLAGLVAELRERPGVGLVGCRQLQQDGTLNPTIRRFPTPVRLFFEALGSERFPFRASWLGQRELDMTRYEHETACDWTSGSFMLARREALTASGPMDERHFLFMEETDLCLRIKGAGWDIRHLPSMTITHPTIREAAPARMIAQEAYSRRLYVAKNLRAPSRVLALAAMSLGYLLRYRRPGSPLALRTLLGLAPPPFG